MYKSLVIHLSFSVVCDSFLVITLYTIFIVCLLAISQSKMICMKKSILLALPAWAAHFIAVKPSLRFGGNREQRGEWGREMRGEGRERGRDDGSGLSRELAVVPLEFYFTEQIIWLTGVVCAPLPHFLHLPSFSSPVPLCPLPLSSRLGRRVCVCACDGGVSGCFPHVLLVMSRGISNDNSPQLPDHWAVWLQMGQIFGPTPAA